MAVVVHVRMCCKASCYCDCYNDHVTDHCSSRDSSLLCTKAEAGCQVYDIEKYAAPVSKAGTSSETAACGCVHARQRLQVTHLDELGHLPLISLSDFLDSDRLYSLSKSLVHLCMEKTMSKVA